MANPVAGEQQTSNQWPSTDPSAAGASDPVHGNFPVEDQQTRVHNTTEIPKYAASTAVSSSQADRTESASTETDRSHSLSECSSVVQAESDSGVGSEIAGKCSKLGGAFLIHAGYYAGWAFLGQAVLPFAPGIGAVIGLGIGATLELISLGIWCCRRPKPSNSPEVDTRIGSHKQAANAHDATRLGDLRAQKTGNGATIGPSQNPRSQAPDPRTQNPPKDMSDPAATRDTSDKTPLADEDPSKTVNSRKPSPRQSEPHKTSNPPTATDSSVETSSNKATARAQVPQASVLSDEARRKWAGNLAGTLVQDWQNPLPRDNPRYKSVRETMTTVLDEVTKEWTDEEMQTSAEPPTSKQQTQFMMDCVIRLEKRKDLWRPYLKQDGPHGLGQQIQQLKQIAAENTCALNAVLEKQLNEIEVGSADLAESDQESRLQGQDTVKESVTAGYTETLQRHRQTLENADALSPTNARSPQLPPGGSNRKNVKFPEALNLIKNVSQNKEKRPQDFTGWERTPSLSAVSMPSSGRIAPLNSPKPDDDGEDANTERLLESPSRRTDNSLLEDLQNIKFLEDYDDSEDENDQPLGHGTKLSAVNLDEVLTKLENVPGSFTQQLAKPTGSDQG